MGFDLELSVDFFYHCIVQIKDVIGNDPFQTAILTYDLLNGFAYDRSCHVSI